MLTPDLGNFPAAERKWCPHQSLDGQSEHDVHALKRAQRSSSTLRHLSALSSTGVPDTGHQDQGEDSYQLAVVNDDGEPSDSLLWSIYEAMLSQDAGVRREALSAYEQVKGVPVHKKATTELRPASHRHARRKWRVPAARRHPSFDPTKPKKLYRRGRWILSFCSSAVLIFVFLQSLIVNKTTKGTFHAPKSVNGMFGADPEVLRNLGALNANEIRNNGHAFRFFWAMWMHAGWIHIATNLACQIQYLYMFEPEWGFTRVLVIFVISGISGNLVSCVANPCSTTVGSSGGLFGLMGAMIPYCIEFWKTLYRPGYLLLFSLVLVIVSLLMGFTRTTDNWAHVGGLIGGLCIGVACSRSVGFCRPPGSETHHSHTGVSARHAGGKVPSWIMRRLKCTKWDCSRGVLGLRIVGLILLTMLWAICFILIYHAYEYQPIGLVTFKGITQCCCCYPPDRPNAWVCNPCTAVYRRKWRWQDYCKLPLARSRHRGLKPEFQGTSLYNAVGLPGLEMSNKVDTSDREPPPTPALLSTPAQFNIPSSSLVSRTRGTPSSTAIHSRMIHSSFDTVLNDTMPPHMPVETAFPAAVDFQKFFDRPLLPEELDWLSMERTYYVWYTSVLQDALARWKGSFSEAVSWSPFSSPADVNGDSDSSIQPPNYEFREKDEEEKEDLIGDIDVLLHDLDI